MNRSLTLESVRLTEAAALYAARSMGKGDPEIAYESAMEAMLNVFDQVDFQGVIVAGADNEDSPIQDGNSLGSGEGEMIDLALKPLDGKETCARGSSNAASFVAMGTTGCMIQVPPLLMYKIATGSQGRGMVDVNQTPSINIKRIARAKKKYIEDVTVCVLDRSWNSSLVEDIRRAGARIKYIRDGDISGAIATAMENNVIDLLIGTGWAKDGIIAAAALKCLGGEFQGRFLCETEEEKKLMDNFNLKNGEDVYTIEHLVPGDDVIVAATGVTDGVLLPGVRFIHGGATTESVVLRQKTHTRRYIEATHRFDFKPIF